MTDKDFLERSVYGQVFPEAQLQLCLFHVLKSLKREIHVTSSLADVSVQQATSYSEQHKSHTNSHDQ